MEETNQTKQPPILIVLAGVNGAGKSTIRDLNIKPNESQYVVIDSDRISKKFREGGLDNAIADLKGGKQAIMLFSQAVSEHKDIFLESTLSGNTIFKRFDKAREQGYHISTIYVGLPTVEYHIKRVLNRVNRGGHDIPKETILKRFEKAQEQLIKAFRKSDDFYYYDNSDKQPFLAFEKSKSIDKLIVYSNKLWVRDIAKNIGKVFNI